MKGSSPLFSELFHSGRAASILDRIWFPKRPFSAMDSTIWQGSRLSAEVFENIAVDFHVNNSDIRVFVEQYSGCGIFMAHYDGSSSTIDLEWSSHRGEEPELQAKYVDYFRRSLFLSSFDIDCSSHEETVWYSWLLSKKGDTSLYESRT